MRSRVTIVIKKNTIQTCIQNLESQKTSISFDKFHVNDCSKKRGFKTFSNIYYPVYFEKNTAEVRVLIDLGSKVNAMALAYAKTLGLWIQKTNVRAQKIDG